MGVPPTLSVCEAPSSARVETRRELKVESTYRSSSFADDPIRKPSKAAMEEAGYFIKLSQRCDFIPSILQSASKDPLEESSGLGGVLEVPP